MSNRGELEVYILAHYTVDTAHHWISLVILYEPLT